MSVRIVGGIALNAQFRYRAMVIRTANLDLSHSRRVGSTESGRGLAPCVVPVRDQLPIRGGHRVDDVRCCWSRRGVPVRITSGRCRRVSEDVTTREVLGAGPSR